MSEREAELAALSEALLTSYGSDARAQRIGRNYLPSRDAIVSLIDPLLQLFYPGYFGKNNVASAGLPAHTRALLGSVRDVFERQIEMCLCHAVEGDAELVASSTPDACKPHAIKLTRMLLARLPDIRATLISDVQAAFDGDPAATSLDEVILAYPGLLAVTVYRVAHELYVMGVPLMPRILTEWAHSRTGADIHPGAEVGPSFFVDHATGVVVGETTRIGAFVKLYQGVTLGAISHPRDADGRIIRSTKRHPNVEDDVTVYANATVLGGLTTVGAGSVVGGSVFLTQSVPQGSRVAIKPPELRVVSPNAPAQTET